MEVTSMKHFTRGLLLSLFLAAITASSFGQMPELKPLKGTPSLPDAKDKDHFVFVVAGDNRPKEPADAPGPVVQEIFKEIQQKGPAFVLWGGDIIYGKNPGDPAQISSQYKQFREIAATGDAPVFNAPGNHEMDDSKNCPNTKMLKLYLEHNGQDEPYGAFNYGNSRFIALNSDDEGKPPEGCDCSSQPEKTKPPGFIGEKQMKLLKQDLEADKDSKAHIFVFLHRPLKGYDHEDELCPKNVEEMKELFKKYPNVSYVVAAHQHMFYNPQGKGKKEFCAPPERSDPGEAPYYLVSGGAGAPLKKNGFNHYLIFTVDGNKVSVEVVPVLDKSKCE
jgi:3',5'-cyclic AMP phosphodiesterase CpdA